LTDNSWIGGFADDTEYNEHRADENAPSESVKLDATDTMLNKNSRNRFLLIRCAIVAVQRHFLAWLVWSAD